MAEQKVYKQMFNRVTLQGTLMDNNLEIKVDKKGKKYISGQVEVMTEEDYIIPVDTFAYELKTSGEKNTIYERLTKFLDMPSARTVGITKAPKVTISSARLEDNSFFSEREGKIVKNWRIGGSFIRTAAEDARTINEFEVEGVVSSIKEVMDKEGEATGLYNIKVLNVGFGNRINELTFRFDDPKAVEYITSNYNPGDLVTLCGKVVYEIKERTVERELGFGEPIVNTYTNTQRLLYITAGSEPISEDDHENKLKDLQTIINQQNNIIKEKFDARSLTTAKATKANVSKILF